MTAQPPVRGDVAVLVPAAGLGTRMGPGLPKALRDLDGVPLLGHALLRLSRAPSVGIIIVAAPPDRVEQLRVVAPTLLDQSRSGEVRVRVVAGGATRQDSVAAALAELDAVDAQPGPGHSGRLAYPVVLVHDAARALAPYELVERVAAAVRAGHDAVIPVLPVVDTVKQIDSTGHVVATVDRSQLRAVQTPQGFKREVLAAAHRAVTASVGGNGTGPTGTGPTGTARAGAVQAGTARAGAVQAGTARAGAVQTRAALITDDAGLVERLGVRVYCVPGAESALKITRPADLAVAQAIIRGNCA